MFIDRDAHFLLLRFLSIIRCKNEKEEDKNGNTHSLPFRYNFDLQTFEKALYFIIICQYYLFSKIDWKTCFLGK